MWSNFRGPTFWEPHLERPFSGQGWKTYVSVFSSWFLQLFQLTHLLTTISSARNTLSLQLCGSFSFLNSQLTILSLEKPFLVMNLKKVLPAHIFFLLEPYCFPSYVLSWIVVIRFIGLLIWYLLPGCKLYGGQKPYLLHIPSRCLAHSRCPKDIC